MSFGKNEGLIDYEIIYRPDDSEQKIYFEINEENNVFEMIYKPKENKNGKKNKIKECKNKKHFHFQDDKEYSGNVIRILDKYFIKNNKNKGKLIYTNKKYGLKEYFEEIDNNYKYKDIIKLKLCGNNNISDMSRMFYGCYHLSSFSEYSNQQNINDFNDSLSENNSYIPLNEEIKSNDSGLIEYNASGLISELNKEYIEPSFFLPSIHNNNTTFFLSEVNNFQNYIEIPKLKINLSLQILKNILHQF